MDIVIPKIRGKASLYRSLGFVGSVSTLVLSGLWIIGCFVAMIYYLASAPHFRSKLTVLTAFGAHFSISYFNRKLSYKSPSFIHPDTVFALTFIYLILSVNLTVASIFTIKAFREWISSPTIKKCGSYWSISAIVMGVYELCCGITFLTDVIHCTSLENGVYAAAAAMTMATLSMKGFLMWIFNMAISIAVCYIHFFDISNCPV